MNFWFFCFLVFSFISGVLLTHAPIIINIIRRKERKVEIVAVVSKIIGVCGIFSNVCLHQLLVKIQHYNIAVFEAFLIKIRVWLQIHILLFSLRFNISIIPFVIILDS